ncbi:GGDEF domain-containing protein [Sulfurimonas sp.]|uniref:GGDEF domain-containing protein n=1 Tax=Sulfurimonas sp. TaxID=2022749 RepID=UPI002636237A|nr:GGDEF domain-containing protein [Sulfurimonas sp.]
MKHSIKNIFKNLNTYLFFVFFVSFLSVVFTFEQQLSFDKIDILNKQKKTIKRLTTLDKSDLESALIEFNSKSVQLQQDIEKLQRLYKYNLTDKYILNNSSEYLNDLRELSTLIKKFNNAVHDYYTNTKTVQKNTDADLKLAFHEVTNKIDTIILKSVTYSKEKFDILQYIIALVFILILLATFWYRSMLNSILKDIEYLLKIDKNKDEYDIFSLETDAIALRMNRKSNVSDNPNLIDAVTGINNYKGLIHSYSHKKSLKDSHFTSVTVLEIDNFSKSNRAYTQEVAQAMLKKVAYTISLNEQPADVIARTDYNQFTIVLSRSSKEQAFKEVDTIRESISELKFHVPETGAVTITVSGGFVIKANNTSLEEAMKQAKEILTYAKSIGKNKIMQIRDLAQKEMRK